MENITTPEQYDKLELLLIAKTNDLVNEFGENEADSLHNKIHTLLKMQYRLGKFDGNHTTIMEQEQIKTMENTIKEQWVIIDKWHVKVTELMKLISELKGE